MTNGDRLDRDEIERLLLSGTGTVLTSEPWRYQLVEDHSPPSGYCSGEVYGGEDGEHFIAGNWLAPTAELIAAAPSLAREALALMDERDATRKTAETAVMDLLRALNATQADGNPLPAADPERWVERSKLRQVAWWSIHLGVHGEATDDPTENQNPHPGCIPVLIEEASDAD
jgi:hypothetical protein